MAGNAKAKKKGKSKASSTPAAPSSSKKNSRLPAGYEFSPAPPAPTKKRRSTEPQSSSQPLTCPVDVRDYPPPAKMFQTAQSGQAQSSQSSQRRSSQPQTSRSQPPPPTMAPLHGSQHQPGTPRGHSISNLHAVSSPRPTFPSPPLQNSSGHSNHISESSDGDSEESEEEEEIDDTVMIEPDLEESRLDALNALLSIPNRHRIKGITTLSPLNPPPKKTTW